MIDRMAVDYGIDPSRVFVVGLSAGGAMTSAMLATYPEVFAGGAIIAGLPYGCATNVQDAFETMARGRDHSAQEWGDLIRSASPHRGPLPRISLWHGSADTIVNPRNTEAILQQWIDAHGLSARPRSEHEIAGHLRRVWRTETDHDVIEAIAITGMGHGVPLAGGGASEHCGNPGPFHFDVGISSSQHIIRFWGLADKTTVLNEKAADSGPGHFAPIAARAYDPPSLAARECVVTRKLFSSRGGRAEEGHAGVGANDPSMVITAALKAAGLLNEPSGHAANRGPLDPRKVISTTLRSVGLLKE
jgi:feruloyl esterase